MNVVRHSPSPLTTSDGVVVQQSLVIPVYKNAENIEDLVAALTDLGKQLGPHLEYIFVVDGPSDASGELLLNAQHRLGVSSKIVFHSRNFGAFTAIRTGMELADGDYVAAMAADLQEPPELMVTFFDTLARDEADVVFGQRVGRRDPYMRALSSNLFWWLYRKLVLPDMPKGGVDIFACNRRVRDEVLAISEPNSSLIAQLFWVGFRRRFVPYVRRERLKGKSAWTFTHRMRYMMDSIFSYSDWPISLVLWSGIIGCVLSLALGLTTFVARLIGIIEQPGYTTLILVILFFGSAILTVQGVMGSYLWRTFENTKNRPLRIISHVVTHQNETP